MTGHLATLFEHLDDTPLSDRRDEIEARCRANFHPARHGKLNDWREAVDSLPAPSPEIVAYDTPAVVARREVESAVREKIAAQLERLKPWRKGPFELHGVAIDAEWRSDLKWARIEQHLDLVDSMVLDVGSGNGYYGWRMLGAGARRVVGIDPTLLFVAQFLAVRKLLGEHRNTVLPMGIDELPPEATGFDHVFSMGVLYHRRGPIEHLERLRGLLRPGGRLILETLIVKGTADTVLVPENRYARMRNVWFIPSVDLLRRWLQRTRFQDIEVLDVSPTTSEEQRCTAWSGNRSLADFLDPDDPTRTIEGHPAPVRAVLSARAP